jgi:UDP-2-acetamido-2,6-beta-L-arabino-hexul-4-ose reductase
VRYAVTGASGLIGWHAAARLHAARAAQRYRGLEADVDLRLVAREDFGDPEALAAAISGCDVLLHFAGVNRGPSEAVEAGNERIAARLVEALERGGRTPTVVFANSTHVERDTPYGRSKRRAAEHLDAWARAAGATFVDLIIPHVFGEHGRPFYNNVTATFTRHVLDGTEPQIDPEGAVELVHAGSVAATAIEAGRSGSSGRVRLEGATLGVAELWQRLLALHAAYESGVFPDLADPLTRDLFNGYRTARGASGWVRPLDVRSDDRGRLFETAKGGGGGQTFVSWTHPGVTRGHHFHLHKVERFVVLEGEAVIRMRRVLHPEVHEFAISGADPTAVDIPTLFTHSIENVGPEPLVTLFWTHETFDPERPDTYADAV